MVDSKVTKLDDYRSNQNSGYDEYSKFKEFDEVWVNSIPSHWESKRFRSQFGYKKGNKPKQVNKEKTEKFDIPYLSMEYLRGDESSPAYAKATDDLVLADSKDILLLWDGSKAGEFIQGKRGAVSSTMAKLFQREENDSRFLYYELEVLEEYLQHNTVGMGIPHVNPNILKNIRLIIPTQEEQKAIAEFLDRETEKINDLIEVKENLIQLVREQEEAIITEVTTNGLKNKVSTQSVKNETLNELPIHWEESTLGKTTKKLTNGHVGPTRDILTDDGVPYIQSMHINNGEIEFNGEFFVSEEWSRDHRTSRLKQGDVLLVQTGVDTGESAIVREDLDRANCHALIIARPVEEVNSRYLNLFLGCRLGKNLLERIQTGATVKHLNTTRVKDITIPVPPKDEQEEIADYLESKQKEFDSTIDLINQGIERLKEYRTALITEAVTGQIDVRGEV
jgi:type I restriction enzyme S subunit